MTGRTGAQSLAGGKGGEADPMGDGFLRHRGWRVLELSSLLGSVWIGEAALILWR